ncbi:unnamed protein product [Symbiodinium natans]|uniref:HTH OST-type domain-containing protein n=1 Tax=Symbiodinium natans TaxID=878477 RepID=A0A812MG67_9DINO|nr:unnamed protein product [Symbiodinium natans]
MLAFVKRAHSVLKLLGKNKGRLVPYFESEDWIRRSNMMLRAPTNVDIGETYVADEQVLCDCLSHLLADQRGWLWMADLKRLFRERFRAEMSETAFGCVSMTELLSQPFILARFNFHKDDRGCGYLCFRRRRRLAKRESVASIRTLKDSMITLDQQPAVANHFPAGSILSSCSNATAALDEAAGKQLETLSWQGLRTLSPMYVPASHIQTPQRVEASPCGSPSKDAVPNLLAESVHGRPQEASEARDDAENDVENAEALVTDVRGISPLPPWCSVKHTFINCDGVRNDCSLTSRSHSAPSRSDDVARDVGHWTKFD